MAIVLLAAISGKASLNESASSIDRQTSAVVTNSATTVVPNNQRPFAKWGVIEAREFLTDLRKEDLAAIFNVWLNAGRMEHDRAKQGAIGSTLATAMRGRLMSPEFREFLREFIASNMNSREERGGVLGILALAASKDSVDILIHAAKSLPEGELKAFAIADLARVGSADGVGEELSPALEKAWREATGQGFLNSLGTAMAQIGSPTSVELLLADALGSKDVDRERTAAARGALTLIYSPNAVQPLLGLLNRQPAANQASETAGNTLMNIGNSAAAEGLVHWLQSIDESAAQLAREWVARTSTPAMLKAWTAAIDSRVAFHNEENREAIRSALGNFKSGRKTN